MKSRMLQLAQLARQRHRRIVGLMSGTSLDGLDIALCQVSGTGRSTRISVEQFQTLPYNDAFKQEIRRVFSKKTIEFQDLVLLNVVIAEEHARLVLQCLKTWNVLPGQVDLIASHGQTVFHAPRILHGLEHYPNATLQIGDGDHIARRTGIITVSDFRQKHLAAGGEGAPLALYGDYFLFSKKGEDRFLLNIGGIANFTFLPGNSDTNAAFATDTGPGNTLLDAFARTLFQVPFDDDARIASNGNIHYGLLERLKSDPFFHKPMPKTIGPELFSTDWVHRLGQPAKGNFNPYDLMATLTRLTADTIAEAILKTPTNTLKKKVYLSGGGAHNPLIVKYLSENLKKWNIEPIQQLGLNGDAKEAVLFALLANELIAGKEQKNMILGGVPLVSMGKISLPE